MFQLEQSKPIVQQPQDPIDRVCEQIELGMDVCRWSVVGRVHIIISRLQQRGSYVPDQENMLWNLHDSAKESL